MREILFRGKRTDTGEWVEGDLFHNLILDGVHEKETRIGDVYFYGDEIHGTAFYEVTPETVGQYTGLTDRNGTRIFEGDIVEMHGGCAEMDAREYDIRCMVVYGRTGYGADIGFAGAYKSGMRISLMCEGCLTVIGNIHDNPELLEG